MKRNTLITVLTFALIAIANIGLSFAYGNNGYEAFLISCLALLILLHWQIILLFLAIKNKFSLFVGLLLLPALIFTWFILFATLMLSMTYVVPSTSAIRAETNWWLVFLGALPYMLPRFLSSVNKQIEGVSLNLLVTIYSVVIALAAIIGFNSSTNQINGIILVIAVELQVIVAFIYSKTQFVQRVMHSTKLVLEKGLLSNEDFVSCVRVMLIGIPLFTPLNLLISLTFIVK